MSDYLYKFVGLTQQFCKDVEGLPEKQYTLDVLLGNNVLGKEHELCLQKLNTPMKNELYFSHPEVFNDYYESKIILDIDLMDELSIQEGKPKCSPKVRKCAKKWGGLPLNIDDFSRLFNESHNFIPFRVCSLCKNWDSQLMWAHYGASGYGVCFKYKVLHDLNISDISLHEFSFSPIHTDPPSDNELAGAELFASLNYVDEPLKYDKDTMKRYGKYATQLKETKSHFDFKAVHLFMSTNLLTKSRVWKYEDEYRTVTMNYMHPTINLDKFTNKWGEKRLELESIILGYKFSDEFSDNFKKLKTIIMKSKEENVKIDTIFATLNKYKFCLQSEIDYI